MGYGGKSHKLGFLLSLQWVCCGFLVGLRWIFVGLQWVWVSVGLAVGQDVVAGGCVAVNGG